MQTRVMKNSTRATHFVDVCAIDADSLPKLFDINLQVDDIILFGYNDSLGLSQVITESPVFFLQHL